MNEKATGAEKKTQVREKKIQRINTLDNATPYMTCHIHSPLVSSDKTNLAVIVRLRQKWRRAESLHLPPAHCSWTPAAAQDFYHVIHILQKLIIWCPRVKRQLTQGEVCSLSPAGVGATSVHEPQKATDPQRADRKDVSSRICRVESGTAQYWNMQLYYKTSQFLGRIRPPFQLTQITIASNKRCPRAVWICCQYLRAGVGFC